MRTPWDRMPPALDVTMFIQLRHPRYWAPALVLALGVALSALTADALRRAERDQRAMQLSNVADGFGALLQMHLAGCEEALRAASMVAEIGATAVQFRQTPLGEPDRFDVFARV